MRNSFLTGLIIWIAAGPVLAEPVPMFDRHIFTPDAISEQKEEAPVPIAAVGSALEKEILFTGVMITPTGKQAIISENAKNEKTRQKHVLKIGDQIKGMTIKEIEPNCVLMASKENTVRMNLYKGLKVRPAPVAEAPRKETGPAAPGKELPPGMTADAQQTKTGKSEAAPAGTPGAVPGAAGKEAQSPFGGDKNNGAPAQNNSGSGTNPFAEILKGAEQNLPRPGNSPVALPFNLPGGS